MTKEQHRIAMHGMYALLEHEIDENQYNAIEAVMNLFDAAPQLLEALERLLHCPDLNLADLEDETCEAIEQAMAAVNKAKEE